MSKRVGSKAQPGGFVTLADVEEEQVRWLWAGRLPLGKISILEGDPDLGKSMVTCDLVARVTSGRPFPGAVEATRSRAARRGRHVILVLAEDDLSDTVRPRLRAAGADLRKVHAITLPRGEDGNLVPLTIPEDLERLRLGIKEFRAALVIIDPITAFLSKDINSHNDASVRQAMTPLAEVAQTTGAAVLLIRHLNKASDMKAMYRGGGSIAFSGAARSVLVVDRHPDDPVNLRVLAAVKGNLTKNHRPAVVFQVESWFEDPSIPVVHWGGEVDLSAEDLLKKPDARKQSPARDDAREFLIDLLKGGVAIGAKEVILLAKEAGISEPTLRRASKDIDVHSEQVRNAKGRIIDWTWSLKRKKFEVSFDD